MICIRSVVVILFITVVYPAVCFSESLSLKQVLDIVTNSHPSFKKEQYQPEVQRSQLEQIAAGQDWNLSSSISRNEYRDDDFSSNSNISINSIGYNGNLNLTKPLWGIGGKLGIGTSIDKEKYTYSSSGSIPSDIDNEYNTNLTVRAEFSLANNLGGILDRFRYEQQEYLITTSEMQANENRELILNQIAHKYFDWVAAAKADEIVAKYLVLVANLETIVDSRTDKNTRISNRINWIKSEARYHDINNKGIMASKLTEFSYLVNKPGLNEYEYDLYDYSQASLLEDHVFQNYQSLRLVQIINVLASSIEHRIAADTNNLKPDVDLLLFSRLRGDDEDFKGAYDDEIRSSAISLLYSQNIGNNRAKSRLQEARLIKRENNARLEETKRNVTANIQKLHVGIVELTKALKESILTIKQAKENTAHDMREFKEGNLDITNMVEILRLEFQQNIQYNQNAALYHHLYIDYLAATDQLWNGSRVSDKL